MCSLDMSSLGRSGVRIRSGRTRIRGGPRPTVRGASIGETWPMTTAGRLRMAGYAVLQLPLAILALGVFVTHVLAPVLAVIVVGLSILMVSFPATRCVVGVHRRWAAAVLGSPVPPPYRPTVGASRLQRPRDMGAH